jgi:peptidoglycan L-alanyl-D-glutamate endopeptidase CwlK
MDINPKFITRVKQHIGSLIPDTRIPALYLLASAADQGLSLRITFTQRTFAQQAALYAQYRESLEEVNRLRVLAGMTRITLAENKNKVTNARPGYSWHNWGRAIDVVPVDAATAPDLSDPDNPLWENPFWESLGEIGESLGFEWGGRWSNNIDKPHFEWHPDNITLDELLIKYPNGI